MSTATHTIETRNNRMRAVAKHTSPLTDIGLLCQQKRQLETQTDPARRSGNVSQRRLTRNLPVNIVLIVAGCIAVVAGIVGIILPGLPTTPFLLLASWCFSRSSQTLYRALYSAPYLGPTLTRWQQHKAVTLRVKITAGVMMLVTVLLAMFSDTLPAIAKCLIVVIVSCVMAVVIRLRTFNAIDLPRS